ncbi:GH92 family glycosyl hydrolase [Mucilaginibacter sp. Bleaf8]|uniref:GH92 family glycosyl hydrolase n=1 Tax=Mucilaginibacter sp. Bleaf8 TaxID=2834430 RepID=UPI001BCE025D|nr:GH92 family glycosyl hydrolase [Mucilaginibacter sp. Bleaf8]MBS7564724.1 GH92 family glycosyl hydrolase [Mucilaginibacter sp. Bleaf8]
MHSFLIKRIICGTIILLYSGAICAQKLPAPVNYAAKVNTLIGTKGKGANANESYLEAGYTFPGAMYPFGMVQFTPTFFAANKGFVVNQLSGAGCEHMGNFPTLPLTGDLNTSPNDMTGMQPGYHIENASAGNYRLSLKNGVRCELSVTKRTGMARYTYPAAENTATVIIGSGVNATQITNAHIQFTDSTSCEGYADGGSFCGIRTNYKVYFVARFNHKPITKGTWSGEQLNTGATSADGPHSGAFFTFDVSKQKTLVYKFAISYVSLANAKANLKAESPDWNFDGVRQQAVAAWNKYLGKIEASGAGADQTTQFYTHLYHALAHPNISNDSNGEYMGADSVVHQAKGYDNYTSFSNWDTYRTQIPLMSLLAPKETGDVMTSTLRFAGQSGGGLPRWVLAHVETGIMQGDPTSIVIANAYGFGVRNFDARAALAIMRKGADEPGTRSQKELTRPYLDQYLTKGYAPASMSLEYNSADFAIGQMGLQATGNKTVYKPYIQRAQYWKNLYNPERGWLQSRRADGGWKNYDEDWREASYKNYFWMVPFNLKGLIDTIGGKQAAERRLDEFFSKLNASYNQEWYAAGNEPDFEVPWIYNWTSAPYKTQAVIRRIIAEQYTNRKNGLPGNDDLGAMGAWYVFANIGLYPMIPGVGGFSVNSPSFTNIKIHLPGNRVLTITGGSATKPYINKLSFNSKTLNTTWLPYSLIKNGGTLKFELSSKPNKAWGTQIGPPSYN